MVGVGWGGACCWILARYKQLKRGRGRGGRGCCRFLARYEKRGGGGGGGGAIGFGPDTEKKSFCVRVSIGSASVQLLL